MNTTPIRIMVYDADGNAHGVVIPYDLLSTLLDLDMESGDPVGVLVNEQRGSSLFVVERAGRMVRLTPSCVEVIGAA